VELYVKESEDGSRNHQNRSDDEEKDGADDVRNESVAEARNEPE
jgi:hypothetical protein